MAAIMMLHVLAGKVDIAPRSETTNNAANIGCDEFAVDTGLQDSMETLKVHPHWRQPIGTTTTNSRLSYSLAGDWTSHPTSTSATMKPCDLSNHQPPVSDVDVMVHSTSRYRRPYDASDLASGDLTRLGTSWCR